LFIKNGSPLKSKYKFYIASPYKTVHKKCHSLIDPIDGLQFT